jgi:pyridinium-3,5-bisthiocarboxylic acid mononucleotide nickel chelatase
LKIAHFDCFYGVSGTKILGALIDAGVDKDVILSLPNRLNLDKVNIEISSIPDYGFSSTKVQFTNVPENDNRSLSNVIEIIDSGNISSNVKTQAKKIYQHLADAKAFLYKIKADKIDLEELASFNSILEVVGSVESLYNLGIERVYSGKISIGGGTVDTPNGKYPVPMPIITELLKGLHIQSGPVEGELVSSVGAAIIAAYTNSNSGKAPGYKLLTTGYGAGSLGPESVRDVMRIIIGELESQVEKKMHNVVIEFNVDDMSPQMIPNLIDKIMEAGAGDAFVTSIMMKKGRPGYLVTVVCPDSKQDQIQDVIFSESTTIGLRKVKTGGVKLKRRILVAGTDYGQIKVKEIISTEGNKRIVPEFEECKRIAKKENLSLKEIHEQLLFELNYKQMSLK